MGGQLSLEPEHSGTDVRVVMLPGAGQQSQRQAAQPPPAQEPPTDPYQGYGYQAYKGYHPAPVYGPPVAGQYTSPYYSYGPSQYPMAGPVYGPGKCT